MARIVVADRIGTTAHELRALLQRFGDEILVTGDIDETCRSARAPTALLVIDDSMPLPALVAALHRSASRPPLLYLTCADAGALAAAHDLGIDQCVLKPFHPRELLSRIYAALRRQTRFVCLGGGAGLYTVLLGLKTLPATHLTAVVCMSDDGGSSGRIRAAYGILPPGDIRRSLVALSTAPELMNRLIQYRFDRGEGLKDHNLGNLLLTAMSRLTGSVAEAVRAMSDILNIQGVVLPVTETASTLVARFADGSVVRGEHAIDVPDDRDPTLRITGLWHEPVAVANLHALAAIRAADFITIGPGDLYTSLLAPLAVDGIAGAIADSRARLLYIGNLMTKPGETAGFTAADHVREIARVLGPARIDTILISSTPLAPAAVAGYASQGQHPVEVDAAAILACAPAAQLFLRDVSSAVSLVRHDHEKLARAIAEIAGLTPVNHGRADGAPRGRAHRQTVPTS
jgi:uncharacterized cofD-like protein